jgi:photosystem II stability/assembly factor-like uncharacterized protein
MNYFNPLPEEQVSLQLVSQLQEIYKMKAEDRESLARIQTQVAAHMKARSIEKPVGEQEEKDQPSPPFPDSLVPRTRLGNNRPQSKWRRRLNLIAAAIVVVLLTGSALTLFSVMQRARTASSPAVNHINRGSNTPVATHKIHQPIYLTSGWRLAMVSDKVSWVVGSDAQAANWSELARTTDGGKTWKRVEIPDGSAALGETIVIDEATALIPAGDIMSNKWLITLDGGASWQHFDFPGATAGPLSFLDHSHIWVTKGKELFQSVNVGKSWQKVATLPANADFGNLVFSDAQTGWFTTGPTWELAGGGTQLFVTHDGGKTWKPQALPAPPSGSQKPRSLTGLTFSSERDGSVLFVAGQDAGTNVYLYTTKDGGRSWQIQGKALPYDNGARRVVDSSHIVADVVDSGGKFGVALLTLNNGKWTKKVLKGGLEGYDFFTAQIGFALVKPQDKPLDWYRTDDGGTTWVKVGTLP